MAPVDYSIGVTTILTFVVILGGVTIFKQRLYAVFADTTCFLFHLYLRLVVAQAKLVAKSVELRFNDNVVCAHYLERDIRTSYSRSKKGCALQDILVVPGFTAEANMMAKLILTMNLPPEVRVCIMELPLHGKNIVNFDGKTFPTSPDIVEYTIAFVKAVGLGKCGKIEIPLTLFGYSLGGGICFEMLSQQPPETYRKVILLAPALKDTINENFNKIGWNDPRKVHGWETFEECKDFFTKTAGGFYPNKLPYLALVGIHRQRELTYDKMFFTNYFLAFRGLMCGANFAQMKQKLLSHYKKTPILVACGDRDNCISSTKCKTLFRDFDEKCLSFHEILDTGHVGGPANKAVMSTILEIIGPLAAEFLLE